MLILAHQQSGASKYELPNTKGIELEHCSVRLFPTKALRSSVVVTGVYIPPRETPMLNIDLLKKLSANIHDVTTGTIISHLIGGDFNTPSWCPLFEEWGLEEGLWQLNDPTLPTANTGSTLDRVLYSPGFYIPSTFIPPDMQDHPVQADAEEPLYPAVVLSHLAISDHYPIILPIPCDTDESTVTTKRLKVSALTEEEWAERNEALRQALADIQEEIGRLAAQKNVDHYYNKIESVLNRVLENDRVKQKPIKGLDPTKRFLRRNEQHPLAADFRKAMERDDRLEAEKLMDKISEDGWRKYLGTVRRSNTRSFYAYLARSDGRRRWGLTPAESAPFIDGTRVIIHDKEKCEAIARAFYRKMQAPAILDTERHHTDRGAYPLSPFRERLLGVHETVMAVEVAKAIRGMTSGKAPGPDGFPTEIYKNLPALIPVLARLTNLIYATGVFPKLLRRVFLVPLVKPGKDPHKVESRRPISLLCTAVKIIESILYHRMLPLAEPRLSPAQYAYRRDRGTEMCLVEMMDMLHRALRRRRFCYLISFDIEGAFDNVSHWHLMEGLREFGIDAHTRRMVHNWLSMRTFQVKMTAASGVCYSNIYPITKGLPQGGVLSPLQWLITFNKIAAELKNLRDQDGSEQDEGIECGDFIFADDITMVITAPTLDLLRKAAKRNVEYLRRILATLSLVLSNSKTKNLVFHPDLFPVGIFRRSPTWRFPSTKKRQETQHRMAATLLREVLEFDPQRPMPDAGKNFWEGFPFPMTATMRVLGVTLDPYLTLDAHYEGIIAKAQMRQGILSRVAGYKWGLETGILRMTHDAVIGSLLRYALVLTGSCLPPDLLRKINTQVVNIAARKVGGLSRSARIESLHYTVGTTTVYNLYVRHCAEFMDACLRAPNSTVNKRLRRELEVYYGVSTFETEDTQIEIPRETICATLGVASLPKNWDHIHWFCRCRKEQPRLPDDMRVPSIYVNNADEINKSEIRRIQMFCFEQTHSWVDVALQVLHHVQWSPECSNPQELNIPKMLPPSFTRDFLHIEAGGDHQWEKREDDKWTDPRPIPVLNVQAGVSVIDQIGMTICLITSDRATLYGSLYIHGRIITEEQPVYLEEAAILHGLRALHGWMRGRGENIPYKSINMRAGSEDAIIKLNNWFHSGELGLESVMASPLAEDIDRLEHWLRTDMWIRPFELSTATGGVQHMTWRSREILRVVNDFRTHALRKLGEEWSNALPLIPLTHKELVILLKQQQQQDEHTAIRHLGELDSVSASVILQLHLTREIINEALSKLRLQHRAQMNLLSILCGTRFKYYYKGILLPTWCPNRHQRQICGSTDTFNHLLVCYDLRRNLEAERGTSAFLVRMAKRTLPKNIQRPRPRYIEPQ